MDLLGRKLGYKQGAVFLNLLNEMRRAADRARELPPLKEMADRVAKATDRLGGTAMRLGEKAASPKIKEAFAYAKPFFDVIGDMCLAWMHLWRATVAAARLEKIAGSLDPAVRAELAKVNKEAAFYEGVLQTAKFYLNVMLPVTVGNMIAIDSGDTPLLDIPEASLGNI
jgi:hypothetical protein